MLNDLAVSITPELGFAHDLRNLLQTATAAIRIIERGTADRGRQVDDAIAGARSSIERAAELARSAFERGFEARDKGVATDVGECLAEAAAILKYARLSSIRIEVAVDPDVGAVASDYSALQNAILNLALNAIDAVAEDGAIALRARLADKPGLVEIAVTDDGVGMTAETVARAFDPYFTTKCEGLGGIGLATVEKFVAGVRGTIAIDSEFGAGTTVRMLLPATPDISGDRR